MEQDIYFKKEVALDYEGETLRFRVAQDLFSSFDVDVGTRFLLKTLARSTRCKFRRILDLGCGYGPLGLALKKKHQDSEIHLVDRDALAVEYSRQNAELNGLSDIKTYGAIGYDDVTARDFDLIVSNIPGKAAESVISSFLLEAAGYLRPGGLVAVVVVAPLAPAVAAILDEAPAVRVVLREARAGHEVFHYQFVYEKADVLRDVRSAVGRGVYDRETVRLSSRGLKCSLTTAQGLPEFSSPSFQTELLIESMREIPISDVGRATVFNPGQGHVPVALWKLISPRQIILAGRDLLSLRYSAGNLERNECPARSISLCHFAGTGSTDKEQSDIIVGAINEAEGPKAVALTVELAAKRLTPGGTVLVAAGSTSITRLVKRVRSRRLLRVHRRRRKRGSSVLVLRAGQAGKSEEAHPV